MTEPEDMDRIITALLMANRQLEINLAIAEAKVYGAHTLMAVDSLVRLRANREA